MMHGLSGFAITSSASQIAADQEVDFSPARQEGSRSIPCKIVEDGMLVELGDSPVAYCCSDLVWLRSIFTLMLGGRENFLRK